MGWGAPQFRQKNRYFWSNHENFSSFLDHFVAKIFGYILLRGFLTEKLCQAVFEGFSFKAMFLLCNATKLTPWGEEIPSGGVDTKSWKQPGNDCNNVFAQDLDKETK